MDPAKSGIAGEINRGQELSNASSKLEMSPV
jgi:hypothetical protein